MTSLGPVFLRDVVVDARSGFACGENPDRGILQLRMHNVTRSCALDFKKRRLVPDGKVKPEHLLRTGDVLFNATNSPDGVGKSALIREIVEPLVFSNHFLRLRTDPERLVPNYLARWLQIRFEHGLFQSMCRQWVNQATVSREALLSLPIALPSLPEQRRIAEMLDRVDALRTKRRQALALLDDLAQSLFVDMFGDAHENPCEFDVRPLDEWLLPGRPMTYGILMPGPDTEGGIPYVRVVDMRAGGIAVAGIRHTTPEISQQYRRSLLLSGDLLISIRGHVGRLALVPDELDGANITQDSARLAVPAESRRYVLAALRSSASQRWMAKRIKGVAVQGINLGDLRKLPLPVPPLEQQVAFAERWETQARAHGAQASAMKVLDGLFASLQQRAFAGRL